MEMHWRIPYGANGWQLCMGFYAIAYGVALLWPDLTGIVPIYHRLTTVGFDPAVIGWVALVQGVGAAVSMFAFNGASI